VRRSRISRGVIWVWVGAALLGVAALLPQGYDYRVLLISRWAGFAPARKFSLVDSLPALSGGLSDLEAFRIQPLADEIHPARANPEQSIWIADSLRRVRMEYFTDKRVLDSVTLVLWTSDSLTEARTFTGRRNIVWETDVREKMRDWTEIVGVYISRPGLLEFHAADTSISLFSQVEGRTLHAVRGRYRDRREQPVSPDTLYPVTAGSELQLLARGNALAIVNPSPRPLELRILRVRQRRWDICRVRANSVQVYRRLLEGLSGPILAYTAPGKTFPILPRGEDAPQSYYWWSGR
jgi:hypothetical protein